MYSLVDKRVRTSNQQFVIYYGKCIQYYSSIDGKHEKKALIPIPIHLPPIWKFSEGKSKIQRARK